MFPFKFVNNINKMSQIIEHLRQFLGLEDKRDFRIALILFCLIGVFSLVSFIKIPPWLNNLSSALAFSLLLVIISAVFVAFKKSTGDSQ